VNIRNILNNPRFWGMAPGTIQSNGLVMHIGMTTETICFSIGKNKGRMAQYAIYCLVLSFQGKFGRVVIERIYLTIQLPPFSAVAYTATYFKIIPMG
jgi:hypothetical protein